MRVRLADPALDAAGVAAIYRPAVESSIATFEEVPPTPDEMTARMRRVLERTPWLVMDDAGAILGYAYASPHQDRPGYRWSVNISVYVADGHRGRGIGRALYDELLTILRRQGFVNAYAGVAVPNPPSVALHTSIGMRQTALYERVGYKLGAWHDVAWFALRLIDAADAPDPPAEPIPLPELSGSWTGASDRHRLTRP